MTLETWTVRISPVFVTGKPVRSRACTVLLTDLHACMNLKRCSERVVVGRLEVGVGEGQIT